MKFQAYKGEVVWIIGASSGIGAALAKELAERGACLALSARSKDKLQTLKESLSGGHQIYPLDVCDANTVNRTANAISAAYGRIDRVIFLAAAYTPMHLADLDLAVCKHMVEVNLGGAFNVVHAVLPILAQQERGQLVLCGSVAGYTGLPNAQPYSATKAGIINLAESLRLEAPESVDVKVINPGFVKTALTDKNSFDMPMMISAGQAAKHIANGLLKSSFEVHFPKAFTLILKCLRLLPYCLSNPILKRMK